jgi:hypothetical protein
MTKLRRFFRRALVWIRVSSAIVLLACLSGIVVFALRIAHGSDQVFECAIALVFLVMIAAGAVLMLAFTTKAAWLLRDFERQTDNIRELAEKIRRNSAENRNEENH